MERVLQITDETLVEVINDYNSSVGYNVGRNTRTWDKGTSKKIKMGELYEVVNTKGGKFILEQGMLLVKDSIVRESLGLPPLDKYSPDLKQLEDILLIAPDAELEELLQYCSDTTIEKIVNKSLELPVQSMSKAKLIHVYSGSDIISMLKEQGSDKTESPKAIAPESEAPRRRKVIQEK